jgi:hypothetical protein
MSTENHVPSQVDEAAELAEQLFAKMYPESEETTPEDEESEDTSDEEEDEEEEDEPEVDPKELKKWRDRYLTLKGKYDAEVPRLASQVKELMEKATSSKKEEVQEPEEDEVDNFEEIYGEDFVNKIRKVINNEVKAKLANVTQKVDTIEETQYKAATESFQEHLDENAEGWRDLWEGKDKGFIKFLQQKDPMGLDTYQNYLTKFNENWDADGMAKIFNLYKETKTSKPSFSKEQEAMIAPSRVKAEAAPKSGDKMIWTEDLMKQFEMDDRNGKYSEEESMAKWQDLLTAAQEGRIRR